MSQSHTVPQGVRLYLYRGDLFLQGTLTINGRFQITQGHLVVTNGATLQNNNSVTGPGILVVEDGGSFINNGSVMAPVAYHEGNTAHGTCGQNYIWTLDESGTLRISGSGAMYSYLNTKTPVWYHLRERIYHIILEDGVEQICAYAFLNCVNLTDVYIGNTVPFIGISAFANCTSLQRVTLPASLTIVGSEAFSGCNALREVHFLCFSPEMLGRSCFYGCGCVVYYPPDSGWTADVMQDYGGSRVVWAPFAPDVVLPSGLTAVEAESFSFCPCTYVSIPAGVTSIGSLAFASCVNLRHAVIPPTVAAIADDAFAYTQGLTIHGAHASVAESYASSHGFTFEAE